METVGTGLVLAGLICDMVGALMALLPDLGPEASDTDRLFEGLHGRRTPYEGFAGWVALRVNWTPEMALQRRRVGAFLLAGGFALQGIGVLVG